MRVARPATGRAQLEARALQRIAALAGPAGVRHRPHMMARLFRAFALLLAAAHVFAAALPCAPADEVRGPAAAPALHARPVAPRAAAREPHNHAAAHAEAPALHAEAAPAEAAPCPGHAARARPAPSYVPVCPCGCDRPGPGAGASSVRIGVALVPFTGPERPAAPHVEYAALRPPAPLDVTLPGPDVVPRAFSIA